MEVVRSTGCTRCPSWTDYLSREGTGGREGRGGAGQPAPGRPEPKQPQWVTSGNLENVAGSCPHSKDTATTSGTQRTVTGHLRRSSSSMLGRSQRNSTPEALGWAGRFKSLVSWGRSAQPKAVGVQRREGLGDSKHKPSLNKTLQCENRLQASALRVPKVDGLSREQQRHPYSQW